MMQTAPVELPAEPMLNEKATAGPQQPQSEAQTQTQTQTQHTQHTVSSAFDHEKPPSARQKKGFFASLKCW